MSQKNISDYASDRVLSKESLAWFKVKCGLSDVIAAATELLTTSLGEDAGEVVCHSADGLYKLIDDEFMTCVSIDSAARRIQNQAPCGITGC